MFSFAVAGLAVSSLFSFIAEPPKLKLEDLGWLAGHWSSSENGIETEELWMAPKGGLMLGTNRTIKPKGKPSFEFLRITETDGGFSYFASPMGRPATEFTLKSLEKNKVVFANDKNDFPQRIIYELKDDQLHARIEGTVQGKERSMQWVWKKAAK